MTDTLDTRACFAAVKSRDRRFDGTFFTGVKTTGIYCRPICPAKTPKKENCLFFRCAAEAESAGFRSCLRCRPESSPGTPAWLGTSATVSRGLRLIDEGFLAEHSVDDLAARLGVGPRHLSRLFQQHLGTTPIAVEQSRMLLLAMKLLRESSLSITDIAFAVGYGSLRRFHAAFRSAYGSPPSQHRKLKRSAPEPNLNLSLGYRSPFDWKLLLGFFALRAVPGVERVEENAYLRTIELGDARGILRVEADPDRDSVRLTLPAALGPHLPQAVHRVRDLFDLRADPRAIESQLGKDKTLAPCFENHPGLRVPGCWDRFELAVRAILGQQVTVKGAVTLATRLVEMFGRPLPDSPPGLELLFPRPEDLVDADIVSIGMPESRAEAIRSLARAVHDGTLELDASDGLEASVAKIRALPGLGEWTAQYIAMRALREPDAIPVGDLGVRRALAEGGDLPSIKEVRERILPWSPWGAYATIALWTSDHP